MRILDRFKDKYNRPLKQRFLDSAFHMWLLDWKPIALCWLFERLDKPVPKYLIGHATFTLTQVAHRFRADDGSETSATWLATQNSAWNATITADTRFRLRFEVNEVGAASGTFDGVLQYSINGSAFVTADLSTNGVRLEASPNITDGVATTNQLTAGTGTFRAGQVRESVTAASATMVGSDHTEVEFVAALHYGFLNSGDVVTFRVVNSGATFTQNNTPTINITKTFNNPPTVVTNTTDATAFGDTTPVLEGTATDPTPNDVQYGLHLDTASTFQGGETLDMSSTTITNGYSVRTAGAQKVGQTFTATTSGRIRRVRFFLWKVGAPTVKAVASIYATSSGVPVGNALATSYTSVDSTALSLTLGGGQWVDFYFLDNFSLASGTMYTATLDIVIGSGTDDASNAIVITGSASSVIAGNYVSYIGGSWGASSTIDIGFYLYTGAPAYTAISTGSGWANTVTGGDTNPFNSGEKVAHTLQTALPTGTYYYRFTAKDPTGGNISAWSPSATRSFTVNGPRPKIKTYGQYLNDFTTPVAVGGTTGTSGMADNLYLQAGIAHVGSASNSATPSMETELVGTSFDNTATQTLRSRTYRNNNVQFAKRGGTLIYDKKNKRYVFFGGYDGTTRYNEVWAKFMDVPGQTWTKLSPSGTAPTGRNLHGSVYVDGFSGSHKSGMYVWGGATPTDLNDMYYLDLTTPGSESWAAVTQTSAPTTRSYLNRQLSSAPSSSGGTYYTEVYLFGGWPGASRANDMYKCTFNPASPTSVTWTTLKTNGQGGNPTARSGGILDYKPSTHKFYLYGGYSGSAMLSDFWEYDIATNAWTNTSPTGTAPTGTEFAAGGYDAVNNRFWFTGGWATDGSYTSNRNNIGYISNVGGSEAYVEVRANQGFAGGDQSFAGHMFSGNIVDTDKGWLVLFQMATPDSGAERYDYIIDFADTATTNFPVYSIADGEYLNSRDAMASTRDEVANEWLQIGGFEDMYDDATIVNGSHGGDVWAYNATTNQWRYAVKGFKAMPQLEGSVAVWDSTRGRAIIFGGLNGVEGNSNGVWSLTRDSVGNYAVKQLTPTGIRPAARWLGIGVFDAARNRAIFALGSTGSALVNDVWSLDFSSTADGAWTQLTPSGSITAVTGPAFGANKSAKRLYIHAGATNASLTTVSTQTAYLDYTNVNPTWTTLSTTNGLGRRTPASDFDEANNAFIVYGGYNGTDVIGATSILTLNTTLDWNHNFPITYPANRRSVVGQLISSKFYVFGGRPNSGTWFKDTWELTPDYGTLSSSTWVDKTPDAFSPVYYTITGGSAGSYHWQAKVVEGSENSLWVSFAPPAINSFYFDASDSGPTDASSAWTNDANAFDGSISTFANQSVTGGYPTTKILHGEGTNAPGSGETIISVRARVYGTATAASVSNLYAVIKTDGAAETLATATVASGSPAWGSYSSLSTPSGGWTWPKIQALEVDISGNQGAFEPNASVYKVEIEVTSSTTESNADYVLGTGTPQFTKTHTTSSNKRKTTTASHTTSANKKKTTTASHTTSSNLVTKVWTYEDKATLPTNDALLANSYSDTDRSNIATNDNVFKDLTGSAYLVEQGWIYHTNNVDEINVAWSGKSTLAPSASAIYLQIYNHTTDAWVTLDFDNTTAIDTEFSLSGSQTTDLSQFYDTGNRVAIRVYQAVV